MSVTSSTRNSQATQQKPTSERSVSIRTNASGTKPALSEKGSQPTLQQANHTPQASFNKDADDPRFMESSHNHGDTLSLGGLSLGNEFPITNSRALEALTGFAGNFKDTQPKGVNIQTTLIPTQSSPIANKIQEDWIAEQNQDPTQQKDELALKVENWFKDIPKNTEQASSEPIINDSQ